jgi:hypothetical protein
MTFTLSPGSRYPTSKPRSSWWRWLHLHLCLLEDFLCRVFQLGSLGFNISHRSSELGMMHSLFSELNEYFRYGYAASTEIQFHGRKVQCDGSGTISACNGQSYISGEEALTFLGNVEVHVLKTIEFNVTLTHKCPSRWNLPGLSSLQPRSSHGAVHCLQRCRIPCSSPEPHRHWATCVSTWLNIRITAWFRPASTFYSRCHFTTPRLNR